MAENAPTFAGARGWLVEPSPWGRLRHHDHDIVVDRESVGECGQDFLDAARLRWKAIDDERDPHSATEAIKPQRVYPES